MSVWKFFIFLSRHRMESKIAFDLADGIATVTLHNPGKLNAVNAAMWRGLSAALRRVADTPEVRCVILRGAGEEAFAAGGDIEEFLTVRATVEDALHYHEELVANALDAIRDCTVPTVAAIRGAVDELKQSIAAPAIAQRLADIAIRESDHLNQIVADFLDFARCPEVQRETFSIRESVKEVTELLRDSCRDNGHMAVETHYPAPDCLVSGHRSQIRQVFMNIAKNGLEAMDEPGTLDIRIIPDATSVEVRFDDEGPGIAPDELARIFEPFYTTKANGVGMGLSVCMRIVTAHDGTLRVTPREGGGLSVSVRLPIIRQEE